MLTSGKIKTCFSQGLRALLKLSSIMPIFLVIFIFSTPIEVDSEELFFTYIGSTIGTGLQQFDYNYWDDSSNSRKTIGQSGIYFNGGLLINVYANNLVGEFILQPMYQSNDRSDTTIYHLNIMSIFKYQYPLNDFFAITAGGGFYFDPPPASENYRGSGFVASMGLNYGLNWSWKLVYDLTLTYGTFQLDENSTKLSYGMKVGFIKKIGKN